METTLLWDLNTDCLQAIFAHLDFVDLLNLADASKKLKECAGLLYARKHESKQVRCFQVNPKSSRTIQFFNTIIEIKDLKTSLQILRCFGNFIHSLEIFSNNREVNEFKRNFSPSHIISYANRYCSESLIDISFSFVEEKSTECIEKPFSCIEKVEFNCCMLGIKVTHFNNYFPNINNLRLYCNQFSNDWCFVQCLPMLKSLTIDATSNDKSTPGFCKIDNVSVFLRLNPQLRHLKLFSSISMQFFGYLSESLPKLESLDVRCGGDSLCEYTGDPIHFKSLKTITIRILSTNHNLSLSKIPLSFEHLEEFKLDASIIVKDALSEFFSQHSSIRKMYLCVNSKCLNSEIKINLVERLPLLEEIEFANCYISMVDAMFILQNVKLLRKLSFALNKTTSLAELKENIDTNKWKMSIDDSQITLKQHATK